VENFEETYTDYLISGFGQATATALGEILSIKHDKITQALAKGEYDSKFLWHYVKPYVREISQSNQLAVLSFDDSIEEKFYTDESELICWHYDHCRRRSVKGVNFLTAILETGGMRLPCSVEFVKKDKWVTDNKTGKLKRVASKTKNELFRDMVLECSKRFSFDYVLSDSWYSSTKNMLMIKETLKTDFIMALKSNRKVALSKAAKDANDYVSIESLQLGQQTVEVWLKGLNFPLLLTRQVFKNEDGTVGELYLACSDLSLSYEKINITYKKRWGMEEYHKSVKSNLGFANSPTKKIRTQTNHFMLSIIAYAKLEWARQRTGMNHFAMKTLILAEARKVAFKSLEKIYKRKVA